jgi:hypothetical protein
VQNFVVVQLGASVSSHLALGFWLWVWEGVPPRVGTHVHAHRWGTPDFWFLLSMHSVLLCARQSSQVCGVLWLAEEIAPLPTPPRN